MSDALEKMWPWFEPDGPEAPRPGGPPGAASPATLRESARGAHDDVVTLSSVDHWHTVVEPGNEPRHRIRAPGSPASGYLRSRR